MESITLRPFYSPGPSGYKFHRQLSLKFSYSGHLMGWRLNIGGWISANSTAVMPSAHMSHCGLPWHQHDTSTAGNDRNRKLASQLTTPSCHNHLSFQLQVPSYLTMDEGLSEWKCFRRKVSQLPLNLQNYKTFPPPFDNMVTSAQ